MTLLFSGTLPSQRTPRSQLVRSGIELRRSIWRQRALTCTTKRGASRCSSLACKRLLPVSGLRDAARTKSLRDCQEPAAMVLGECPRFAVAADARPVRDLGLGDHAPANTGQDGGPLLGTLDALVADDSRASRRETGAGPKALGGPWLLLARAESACGSAADSGRAQRHVSVGFWGDPRLAGGGPLHGGSDCEHRVQ